MIALPATLDARFAAIIDLLCRVVAARARGGLLGGLSAILVWMRLRRLGIRFLRLSARIAAGRDSPRCRPNAPPPRRPHAPQDPSQRLPRGRAWLIRLVPETAAGASQLQHLLTTPEMAALIAASPRVGRVLRPLCHTLGVTPPPALHLPPRPARLNRPKTRKSGPVAEPSARRRPGPSLAAPSASTLPCRRWRVAGHPLAVHPPPGWAAPARVSDHIETGEDPVAHRHRWGQ